MSEIPENVQRWTAKRRSALVLSIIKGETSVAEAARTHGLTVAEIERWREAFLAGAENALRSRPKDEEAVKDEQIATLQRKVGELVLDIDILEGGEQGPPFRAGDVRRVREALPQLSERHVCRVLEVPRSSLHERPASKPRRRPLDETLVARIAELIRRFPTYGYRKLWALLRYTDGLLINVKVVYRILAAKRWFVHQRALTPRPRVQGRRSVASASNTRWAIDLTHIYCGADGWGHLRGDHRLP